MPLDNYLKGKKNLTELEKQLSLALQIAALCNMDSSCASWGNPSPFQKKINKLLVACGRKRTPRPKQEPQRLGDLIRPPEPKGKKKGKK